MRVEQFAISDNRPAAESAQRMYVKSGTTDGGEGRLKLTVGSIRNPGRKFDVSIVGPKHTNFNGLRVKLLIRNSVHQE